MKPTINIEEKTCVLDLLDFIHQSPSPFHVVNNLTKILAKHGFQELKMENPWTVELSGKYYVTKNNSALIAFVIGQEKPAHFGFHIVSTHTDSPGFRLKPYPEMPVHGKYLKLNVETYGSPILNTWLDRPLSLAGRVVCRGESPYHPQTLLYHSTQPLLVIPNLAIHMNRKVNEGVELNKQKDMLPLLSMLATDLEGGNFLTDHLAEKLQIPCQKIIDFDLFLHESAEGCIFGLDQEFISASRLDDLAMVHSGVTALTQTEVGPATNVLACFDNEECGNTSKQGAASPFLRHILERITLALNAPREEYYNALANSFLISADMAHALHPNSGEKHDPINKPVLNGGPVIKISANHSYSTDADSSAVFETLCNQVGVPVQKFANRSDERGGSTIGPISSTQLDIRSIDVGNPLLAMHSIRETAGVKDQVAMIKVLSEFFHTA